jgi:hypothetical protein
MRGWMIVAALALPLTALAQNDSSSTSSGPTAVAPDASASSTPAATPAAAPAEQGFGSQTRLWLATQTSGTASVSEARPMPGEVATLVYQRYLNSFTHPIPERYSSESFKASGTGGGTSSTP